MTLTEPVKAKQHPDVTRPEILKGIAWTDVLLPMGDMEYMYVIPGNEQDVTKLRSLLATNITNLIAGPRADHRHKGRQYMTKLIADPNGVPYKILIIRLK